MARLAVAWKGPLMTSTEIYVSLLEHFARYFDATDRGDLDELAAILADATVVTPSVETSDPAVVRAAYAARHPAPGRDGRRLVKNHATNLIVDGPDQVGFLTATVYYTRVEPGDGAAAITTSGRIAEQVVRDGDRWRVLRHTVIPDI